MTHQDIVFLVRKLAPCGGLAAFIIIEIINAIRGKQPYTILLIREFGKMIIYILREIKGGQWTGKFNAMACLVPCIVILSTLCFAIGAGFKDYTQTIVPFSVAVIFGFIFYWTFKTSTNFLGGYH